MRERDRDLGEITVGSESTTVRRPHETRLIVARILHRELDPAGRIAWVVLDRLVHDIGMDCIGDWSTSGAVTTELRRRDG